MFARLPQFTIVADPMRAGVNRVHIQDTHVHPEPYRTIPCTVPYVLQQCLEFWQIQFLATDAGARGRAALASFDLIVTDEFGERA